MGRARPEMIFHVYSALLYIGSIFFFPYMAIKLARSGYFLSFTPDGPKGPRYQVQMGAVQAAMATGLPIYPVTYSARKKKH